MTLVARTRPEYCRKKRKSVFIMRTPSQPQILVLCSMDLHTRVPCRHYYHHTPLLDCVWGYCYDRRWYNDLQSKKM